MIRRELLIATAVIASVGINACSDMTAPKKLVPGGLPAAAILAQPQVAASDREGNRKHVTVVATIKGRGRAEMQDPIPAGTSVFWTGDEGVRLLSDGSAKGDFTCIDLPGNPLGDQLGYPANISGKVTSWSLEGTVIVLNVIGTLVPVPGGPTFPPQTVSFTVKIQKFGGAGVGRWTLQDSDPPTINPPGSPGSIPGFIFCYELVTSGKIVIVYREDDDRDHRDDDHSGR